MPRQYFHRLFVINVNKFVKYAGGYNAWKFKNDLDNIWSFQSHPSTINLFSFLPKIVISLPKLNQKIDIFNKHKREHAVKSFNRISIQQKSQKFKLAQNWISFYHDIKIFDLKFCNPNHQRCFFEKKVRLNMKKILDFWFDVSGTFLAFFRLLIFS